MLRFALWTLRQRRYLKLAVAMVLIAVGCVAAGTWQISRYRENVRDNRDLKANAHAPTQPLTTSLVPLTGRGASPSRDAIRYRAVSVTGTYLAGRQQYLVEQSSHGRSGYWVVDPLRTIEGVVLVARGFVEQGPNGGVPADVPGPPAGRVRVTGRLQTASGSNDDAARLGGSRIETINVDEQAASLGLPVYQTYLTLDTKQASTAGLTPLGGPDGSNPAGGAVPPQHLAYVIQWYLFALFALAAPFVLARRDVRDAQRDFLGIDTGEEQWDLEPEEQFDDPPALTGSAGGAGGGGALAVRSTGSLQRRGDISEETWQRAARMADRYNRSLGDGTVPLRRARRRLVRPLTASETIADSAAGVHRSEDEHHGAYNDYLWELALADGSTPDLSLRQPVDERPAVEGATPSQGTSPRDAARTVEPRVIDHDERGRP